MINTSSQHIYDIITNLLVDQTYTWPLVNDTNSHYKFYNIKVTKKRGPSRAYVYDMHATWGKIDTKGKTIPYMKDGDSYDTVNEIVKLLKDKKKKGYSTASSRQYNVVSNGEGGARTFTLNHTPKMRKLKKKFTKEKQKNSKNSIDKRFDDLII